MFPQVSVCSRREEVLVSVQVGLHPGVVSVQGVSVLGSLCPRVVSLSRGVTVPGVSLYRGSLSRGVSVWGGLCPGGLCHGEPPYSKERTVRILLKRILVFISCHLFNPLLQYNVYKVDY